MKERLKEFLLEKGMNAKSFALKIGVQPSSISHILTGRNKPSVELLDKLLKSFPEADIKYLISGIKSELKDQKTHHPIPVPGDSIIEDNDLIVTSDENKNTDVTSDINSEKVIVLYADGTFSEYFPR